MRNKYFIWIVSALLIITGCTYNEIDNEKPTPEVEGRTLVITASAPDESPETRLSLEPETGTKNIVVKWKAGDVLYLVFDQTMTVKEGTPITLTQQNISSNGKVATFTVAIPQGIDVNKKCTIYAVHGATYQLNMYSYVNVNVSPVGFSLLNSLNNVPVSGVITVNNLLSPITINFGHLGLLQCLNFKNTSTTDFVMTPTLVNNGGISWYHTYSGGTTAPHYNLYNYQVSDFTVTPSTTAPVTIPAGGTVQLAQWVMPKNVNTPEIKLNAVGQGGVTYTSINSKPARGSVMQKGKAYHLYALWDGSKVCFTDNTFIPALIGDVMHADGGSDFIGVVYSKGDDNVYYNSTQNGTTWSGETWLGTGTDARIAIDGNNRPHVVFTTTDHTIAYLKHNGTAWNAPVYIESNNVGAIGKCSKPDIDVDGSGYAHITYTDTKGGDLNAGYQADLPNIMYAENQTNSGGVFVKTIAFDGYVTQWEEYHYIKGSRIAVNAAGTFYYIIAHKYFRYINPENHTYSVAIKTPTTMYGASATSPTDQHDIYDLEFDGTKAVALYKDTNGNQTATIKVQGTQASFVDQAKITTPGAVPHTLSHKLEIAGLSGSNLFAKYFNAGPLTEYVYTDITVRSGTKVAAVNKGNTANKVYAIYTNADSVIKVKEIASTP
jgi:hypothetical protein